jgi:hypothetical protein
MTVVHRVLPYHATVTMANSDAFSYLLPRPTLVHHPSDKALLMLFNDTNNVVQCYKLASFGWPPDVIVIARTFILVCLRRSDARCMELRAF